MAKICRNDNIEPVLYINSIFNVNIPYIRNYCTLKFQNESGPSERRPFSREIDLQVNRFDEAQKQAVLKKAQLLDNRFLSGESKFL